MDRLLAVSCSADIMEAEAPFDAVADEIGEQAKTGFLDFLEKYVLYCVFVHGY